MTDLMIPETTDLTAAFQAPEAIDKLLADVESRARAHEPDISTVTGRKAIASVAYQVARSKTAFDAAGKALTEQMRKQIGAVDAERRRIRDRLDVVRDEVRAPLTEWEAAEDARVERIKERIAHLSSPPRSDDPARIREVIAEIEAVEIDDSFAEFIADASKAKDATLRDLRRDLDAALYREARARREAEEAEKRRAEEEARRKAEAERLEAERAARAEAERKAAVEAAEKRAREEAERETSRKIAEAEARVKAAHEAEMRKVREAEEARQREAARQEAERKAAEEAEAKRAKDTKHRAAVRARIADAIEAVAGNRKTAEDVAAALMTGKIPHVEVRL